MKRLFLVAALALTATACQTAPVIPATDQVAVAKGETSLEVAYSAAATAYLQQTASGALTGPNKATCKLVLQKWLAALHALRTAEKAGDATTVAAELAAIPTLASEAGAILKAGS